MATVDVSLAVVLSNAKADVAKHKSASNTIWASFCMDLPSRLKSAEKRKKSANYFVLSYLSAQIAHSTVHRCCTFSFFGGQPPLLPAVMALIGRASLGNLKQLKGR